MNLIWDVEIPKYWEDITTSYSFDSNADKDTLLDLVKRATATYKNAKIIYDQNVIEYRTLSKFSDKEVLESFLDKTINTAQTLTEATRNISNLYNFFITYNNERKRTIHYSINTYNVTLKSDTSSANSYLSNVISAKNSIVSSKTTLNNAIITLSNLEKNQPLDLAAQETNLKIQQETYNKFKNPSATDVKSARLSLAQAQQTLSEYQENLKNCSIIATIDGVLSTITADLGDDINIGDSLATVVTENMIAQLSFNEVDIAKIKVEQKTTLTFDAISDLSLTGKVVEVDSVGTVSQGVVSYIVKIAFDVQDERIKSGMSVNADIITEVKQDVLLVPVAAVRSNNESSYIETFSDLTDSSTTITSNKTPNKKNVEVGSSNDDYTEIVSGLSEGDKIIVKTSTVSNKTSTSSKTSTTTTRASNSSLFNVGGGMMRPD